MRGVYLYGVCCVCGKSKLPVDARFVFDSAKRPKEKRSRTSENRPLYTYINVRILYFIVFFSINSFIETNVGRSRFCDIYVKSSSRPEILFVNRSSTFALRYKTRWLLPGLPNEMSRVKMLRTMQRKRSEHYVDNVSNIEYDFIIKIEFYFNYIVYCRLSSRSFNFIYNNVLDGTVSSGLRIFAIKYPYTSYASTHYTVLAEY